MADLTKKLDCSKTQNTTNKMLLEGARTALALNQTGSQQRISSYANKREKLEVERASLNLAFRKIFTYSDSKTSHLQATMEN